MPKLKLEDIGLYYEIQGQGEPLMLVAGLASDSQSWQTVIEGLSSKYQVITPDNRGVGRTSPQNAEISIPLITDDCIALAKHLGLSSFNLLGHSMGGLVALDCAIRYPEYVAKLLLAGTSAYLSRQNNDLLQSWANSLDSGMTLDLWFRKVFHWLFTPHFFDNEVNVDIAVKCAVEYPYPQSKIAFKNQVKAIKEFNCQEKLPQINAKALIICGKEDLIFSPEESIRILKKIPQSESVTIENAAHSIHVENPGDFINSVLEFLKS